MSIFRKNELMYFLVRYSYNIIYLTFYINYFIFEKSSNKTFILLSVAISMIIL